MASRWWSLVLGLSIAVCGVAVLAGPVRLPTPGMHAQRKEEEEVPVNKGVKITTKDGTLSAVFPSKPTEQKVANSLMHILKSEDEKSIYFLNQIDLPKAIDLTKKAAVAKAFEASRDSALGEIKGKLLSKKDLVFGKFPGYSFEAEYGDSIYRSRLCLTGKSLVLVAVGGSKEFVDGDAAKSFLDSLKPEGEDAGTKPVEDVTRIDDPDVKPTTPKAKPTGDLAQAAREASHRAVKALLTDLSVAHDEVIIRGSDITVNGEKRLQGRVRIAPLVDHSDDTADSKEPIELQLIDAAGKPTRTAKVDRKSILSTRYHEQIAAEEVTKFLEDRSFGQFDPSNVLHLGRLEQIQAGETALRGTLQMHQSARERGARKGPGWDKVEAALRLKLLEVKLMRLDLFVENKSWNTAFDLTQELVATFDRPEEHAKIALPLGKLLEKAVKGESYTQDKLRDVRRRLRQIEDQFPGRKDLVEPIHASLRAQAQVLLDQAKELMKEKKLAEASDLLKLAEETWPDLEGLSSYRFEVAGKFQMLKVGMREMPIHLLPGTAHTDAERRASELIFESLVSLTPDDQGALYYRPVLARERPRVVTMGRQFDLPRNAKWSDGNPITANDLSFTLKQIKDGHGSERGPAWGGLLEKVEAKGGPFRMNLLLSQGLLDPLSAMSFKVLPQRSRQPAEKPIGSGPFTFEGRPSEQYALFKANPHYGARGNRLGLPHIRELRIYTSTDPVKDMKDDRVDMVTDLSAEQAAALEADPAFEVRMPTAKTPNRRIYFLAINHRKPSLANVDLRIALARAINRDKLLDAHFRKGLGKKVHRAINGPYPAGSWACSPQLLAKGDDPTCDPFDADLARSKFGAVTAKLGQGEIGLTLTYPSGDPVLAAGMTALCEQVNTMLVGVKLTPKAMTPHDLRDAVEQTFSYELAYYFYDFPDESYWLKPLLGGENYLGYTGPLLDNIEKAMTLRHFSQVREYAHAIHRQALETEMPLIPLWQLDPLIAVRKGRVVMPTIDPQALFTRVEEWNVRGAGR